MSKSAIIHVENSDNILEFAEYLASAGWAIISADKTEELLKENNIPVIHEPSLVETNIYLSDFSQLIRRILLTKHGVNRFYANSSDVENDICIVCMNVIPGLNTAVLTNQFDNQLITPNFPCTSILRSSTGNYENVLILTDPSDYKEAIIQLKTDSVTKEFRTYLAAKALNLLSAYDAGLSSSFLQIANKFGSKYMNYLMIPFKKEFQIKCGSNTQQDACLYKLPAEHGATGNFLKFQGRELTYNIIADISYSWGQITNLYAALKEQYTVKSTNSDGYEFTTQFTPLTGTVFTMAVKFCTILGAGLSSNVLDSFKKTYTYDAANTKDVVLACSAVIDSASAAEIIQCDFAAIVAPSFTNDAKQILSLNKKIKLIPAVKNSRIPFQGRFMNMNGGILLQDIDAKLFNHWKIKTKNRPSQIQTDEMVFGMMLVMGARSYSAVILKQNSIVGISQGCSSTANAIQGVLFEAAKYNERTSGQKESRDSTTYLGDVLVTDAEIPFNDTTKSLVDRGIKAIMQTGGTPMDKEFIDYCNEREIVMVFTDMTHISF